MSGVLSAATISAQFAYSITIGNGTLKGYWGNGPVGAISSSRLKAATIYVAASNPSFTDFTLQVVETSLPQDYFTSLTVEDGSGVKRTYTSASATYGSGIWNWGTGSDPVFAAGDASESRFMIIRP